MPLYKPVICCRLFFAPSQNFTTGGCYMMCQGLSHKALSKALQDGSRHGAKLRLVVSQKMDFIFFFDKWMRIMGEPDFRTHPRSEDLGFKFPPQKKKRAGLLATSGICST